MLKRYGSATLATVFVVVVLWSTTFAGIAAALQHFSAGHLLLLRWGLTALGFAVYALLTRMRLPERRDLPAFALAGLLGFGGYQLLLVYGQQGVSPSMAGFLVNLNPVFTTLIAVALGRDSANRFTWLGLAGCLGGLVLMGSAKGSFVGSGEGMVLIALSALSFALYTLVSKPLFERYTPMEVTTYAVIAGSLPFLAFAPGVVGAVASATPLQLATVVFLAALPGGVAFVLWSRCVATLSPGVASRFLYLVPVVGLGVTWVWLGTAPQPLTVLGGLVTMAGVGLASVRAGDPASGPLTSPVGVSAGASSAVAAGTVVPETATAAAAA